MRSFQLLSALAVSATALIAQVDMARITGTITDQTGARIPGVKVIIRNLETNIETQTAADAVGVLPLRAAAHRPILGFRPAKASKQPSAKASIWTFSRRPSWTWSARWAPPPNR